MPDPTRTRAYQAVYELLETAAHRRTRVSYSEVANRLDSVTDQAEPPGPNQILRQIAEYEHRAGRPLLTALVVTGKNIPGNLFFESARELGCLTSADPAAEMEFWTAEEERVYQRWRE